MNQKSKTIPTYVISIAIALAVGVLSAVVNSGKMNTSSLFVQAPLSPPSWIFPIVWGILFTLMGISAAQVWLSNCTEKTDALFIYAVQLTVNFLWTIFFFSFKALFLSFCWLIFLILLVLLMTVRFERCEPGAGKLQIPYLLWLGFAAYLTLFLWLLNR